MADITELKQTDRLIDSAEIINDNFNALNDEKLDKSGGDLDGNIFTHAYDDGVGASSCKMIICKSDTVKGTMPTKNQWHTLVIAKDSNSDIGNVTKYGQIETAVETTGKVYTTVQAFKNEEGSGTSATIAVGYNADGTVYTQAPTPPTTDNSTQIATTAFVNNYALAKSGGTVNGEIVVVKNDGGNINVRSATSQKGLSLEHNLTSGNRGLYDRDLAKWILRAGSDGSINTETPNFTDSNTKIATTAFVNGARNTITLDSTYVTSSTVASYYCLGAYVFVNIVCIIKTAGTNINIATGLPTPANNVAGMNIHNYTNDVQGTEACWIIENGGVRVRVPTANSNYIISGIYRRA